MRKRFRIPGLVGLAVVSALATSSARAEAPGVLACDSLVALRVLMAAGDRSRAEADLPAHPDCRVIPRDRIGAAEHRAMVGGAPFECLTVRGGSACVWVWP